MILPPEGGHIRAPVFRTRACRIDPGSGVTPAPVKTAQRAAARTPVTGWEPSVDVIGKRK